MRIAYNNFIDDIDSLRIVATSEESNFPIANVKIQRLAVKYTSKSPSAQSIIIDLESAREVNTMAIIGHNISTSATIILSANSSNTWPGAVTETISVNKNMILKFFSSHTYQYWKIDIDDPTNTDGYISIGRIYLGDYITVDPSSVLDFNITKKRDDNITYGRGRQKFSSVGTGWRKFTMQFPSTNYAMVKKIEDLTDKVGLHTSFIFCNFDTNRDFQIVEPCYCSLSKEITFNHEKNMKFKYSLELEEDL
jgi:hypothetical protein